MRLLDRIEDRDLLMKSESPASSALHPPTPHHPTSNPPLSEIPFACLLQSLQTSAWVAPCILGLASCKTTYLFRIVHIISRLRLENIRDSTCNNMASTLSTGSPKLGRKSTPTLKMLDATSDDGETPTNLPKVSISLMLPTAAAFLANFIFAQIAKVTSTSIDPSPLHSNKLGNLQPKSTGDLKVGAVTTCVVSLSLTDHQSRQ
jgi:hypothetical protein